MYWSLTFRFLWYVLIYKGEDNIPLEMVRNLRMRVTFKGKELGYSSMWVREKLLKQRLQDVNVADRDFFNAWTKPNDG